MIGDEDETTTTRGIFAVLLFCKKYMLGMAKWRVRIYQLASDESWMDRGTGYCDIAFSATYGVHCITVRAELPTPAQTPLRTGTSSEGGTGEVSAEVLLESRVQSGGDVYVQQQDTLILWAEPDGRDFALSFQAADACDQALYYYYSD